MPFLSTLDRAHIFACCSYISLLCSCSSPLHQVPTQWVRWLASHGLMTPHSSLLAKTAVSASGELNTTRWHHLADTVSSAIMNTTPHCTFGLYRRRTLTMLWIACSVFSLQIGILRYIWALPACFSRITWQNRELCILFRSCIDLVSLNVNIFTTHLSLCFYTYLAMCNWCNILQQ